MKTKTLSQIERKKILNKNTGIYFKCFFSFIILDLVLEFWRFFSLSLNSIKK